MGNEANTNSTDSSATSTESTTNTTFDMGASLLAQQGLEDVSEALLRGDDDGDTSTDTDSDAKEKSSDSSTEDKGGDKGKDEEDAAKGKDDENSDETDDEDNTDKSVKIPSGYVKLEALHEARSAIKDLRAENTRLKLVQYETVTNKVPTKLITEQEIETFKDFQVLSKTALRELNEDDHEAGIEYMEQFGEYQDFLRRQDQQTAQDESYKRHLEESTVELQQIYTTAEAEMEKAIPGLFDNPEVQESFRTFAVEVGFTEDMFYLTNPETKIILPGETEALVLGEQAADIVKLLASVRSKLDAKAVGTVEAKELEAQIRKELEPTLRKEIQAELVKKFKKTGGKEKFQHIDEIPDSDKSNKVMGKVLSESEFARLSPAAQDEYLRGN